MNRFDRPGDEPPLEQRPVLRPWFAQVSRITDGLVEARSERFLTEAEARQWVARYKLGDGWELAAYQEYVDGYWESRMAREPDVDGRTKVARLRELVRSGRS